MKFLFIILFLFILVSCWAVLATTLFNGEKISTTVKIKTICYWLMVIISYFAGYYFNV